MKRQDWRERPGGRMTGRSCGGSRDHPALATLLRRLSLCRIAPRVADAEHRRTAIWVAIIHVMRLTSQRSRNENEMFSASFAFELLRQDGSRCVSCANIATL